MRVWNEQDHPRDWRGRFITTGVHVQVAGGLIGTVRGLRDGRLEGDPAEALVELPDGRVGTIPTDRLTVADPPNGFAWLGDGSMATIGDIVVSDDGREVEIVDITGDGSITVSEENDFGNEENVDPSSLSRGRQMATDDDPTPQRIAESNVPEPPDQSPAADDLEPISDPMPEYDDVRDHRDDALEPISDEAPDEEVSMEVPESLQPIYDMFYRAAAIADEQDENPENHEMVTVIGRRLLMGLELNDINEDHPLYQAIQQRIDYHADRKDQIEMENATTDSEANNRVHTDADGNELEDGDLVETVDGSSGGRIESISYNSDITYRDSNGDRQTLPADQLRRTDNTDHLNVSFLPEEKDPAEFGDWGDRAETIAKSKGPKLNALHAALDSNNRSELRDAIHAGFNGEKGLGKDGAYVKFSHVHRGRRNDIKLSGKVHDKDGKVIGTIERSFIYDDPSDPEKITEVHNDYLSIESGSQGQGIARDLYRNQEDWLIREGVPKVTIDANIDVGGYAWARAGYDYDGYNAAVGHASMMYFRAAQRYGRDDPITVRYSAIYQDLIDRQNTPEGTSFPTPWEMSRIGYEPGMTTWPGKELMLGTNWSAVKYLVPPMKSGDAA